jgi:hypothetical protein
VPFGHARVGHCQASNLKWKALPDYHPAGLFPLQHGKSGLPCGGTTMNTLERRQIVRGQVIDMAVAKTAVNKSRRERADAAKKLRKALAASRYAKLRVETISYPRA